NYSPEPFTDDSIVPMVEAASNDDSTVTVRRISEQIQSNADTMHTLHISGVQPGGEIVIRSSDGGIRVVVEDVEIEHSTEVAGHILVAKPSAARTCGSVAHHDCDVGLRWRGRYCYAHIDVRSFGVPGACMYAPHDGEVAAR